MASSNNGHFVWHEHLTKDPKAAVAFYTEVIGWKTQPFGDDGRSRCSRACGTRPALIVQPKQSPLHWWSSPGRGSRRARRPAQAANDSTLASRKRDTLGATFGSSGEKEV